MKPRARLARRIVRDRRRGYNSHALLCRCRECVDYGAPAILGPMTGYGLFLWHRYTRSD